MLLLSLLLLLLLSLLSLSDLATTKPDGVSGVMTTAAAAGGGVANGVSSCRGLPAPKMAEEFWCTGSFEMGRVRSESTSLFLSAGGAGGAAAAWTGRRKDGGEGGVYVRGRGYIYYKVYRRLLLVLSLSLSLVLVLSLSLVLL